jgi:hypothetical protein
MSQLVRYTAGPTGQVVSRQQRAVGRACQAATADAQIVRARIAGRALATAAALQSTAALSALEAQLSVDEVVARRLGAIMQVAATGMAFEIASLTFEV